MENISGTLRPGLNSLALTVTNEGGPGAAFVQLKVQDGKEGEVVMLDEADGSGICPAAIVAPAWSS